MKVDYDGRLRVNDYDLQSEIDTVQTSVSVILFFFGFIFEINCLPILFVTLSVPT